MRCCAGVLRSNRQGRGRPTENPTVKTAPIGFKPEVELLVIDPVGGPRALGRRPRGKRRERF